MCGRFTPTQATKELLPGQLGVPADAFAADCSPRSNIVPLSDFAITTESVLTPAWRYRYLFKFQHLIAHHPAQPRRTVCVDCNKIDKLRCVNRIEPQRIVPYDLALALDRDIR